MGASAAPGAGASAASGAGAPLDEDDGVPDAIPPRLAEESDSEDESDDDEPAARTGRRGRRLPSGGQREDADGPADLREQELTAADRLLSKVYGDSVHRNDGRHLHGGIPAADDEAMRWLYDQVVSHGHRLFRPPDGAVGQDVILTWVDKLCGCCEEHHNAERAMTFPVCVLARDHGISGATAIRRRNERRLRAWKDRLVAELTKDIVASDKGWKGDGRAPRNKESAICCYH